jgi:hypothetical protein
MRCKFAFLSLPGSNPEQGAATSFQLSALSGVFDARAENRPPITDNCDY